MPECMRHGIFVWSSAQPVSSSWGKGLFVWSDSERLIFLFGMRGGSRTMSNGSRAVFDCIQIGCDLVESTRGCFKRLRNHGSNSVLP